MRVLRPLLTLLLAGLCAFSAEAGATSALTKTRLAASKAVVPGYWHASLDKCKAYAKANNVPLIAVWSNGDLCGHCVSFEQAVMKSDFINWQRSSGIVFCFVHSGDSDGAANGSVYNYCWGNKSVGQFPFVRMLWTTNKGKTTKIDTVVVGDTVDGGRGDATGAKKAVAYFKAKFKAFTPKVVVKYTGGQFDFGDTETDRLEVEAGVQTNLTVSLARTNATAIAACTTNRVVAVLPVETIVTNAATVVTNSSTVVTNTVVWKTGDETARFDLDVSAFTAEAAGATDITLTLLDAAGAKQATRTIPIVAPVANAPDNPYWIGERTADTLDWGEWTMDLDMATNKVAAYNAAHPGDRATTLVLLEGALWCPDCKNTDANLLHQPEFTAWAQSNKVALVALDVARGDATSKVATLLTRVAGGGYNASGAAYLARKGIPEEDGEAVLARNFALAQKLRLPNWTNVTRPPAPSFFVLRDTGTFDVAGRIQYFGNVESPTDTSNVVAHLRRFDELLAQQDESGEELNDTVTRTTQTIGKRETVNATLSAVDSCDVYRLLPGETVGRRLNIALAAENAALQLKVVEVLNDGVEKTLAETEVADGAAGTDLSVKISSSNCYVAVSYKMENNRAVEARFAMTNAAASLCPYALTTDFVVEPREVTDVVTLEDDSRAVKIAVTANTLYRVTNLATVPAQLEAVSDGAVPHLYRANVTDDVDLALTGDSCEVQIWNPGTVGFATTSASIPESTGTYALHLVRKGGVSGRVTVTVALNAELSTKLDHLLTLPDFETLVWEEGESDEKTIALTVVDNDFSDGDQAFSFTATPGGYAAGGILQFRLVLRDNDLQVPGRLAISATSAREMAKAMTTYVRAGEDLGIVLSREEGADGILRATLATTLGALDATAVSWQGRETADRVVTLSGLTTAGSKAKVTLTPVTGTAVDSSRRTLTVHVLAADAPGFTTTSASIAGTRYVPVATTTLPLDDQALPTTKIKRYSGALAPGLSWRQVGSALEISGVPTKAGVYTAVFRAYNGGTAGLAVTVEMNVVDPTTEGTAADGASALNAAVAVARTFTDVPVIDDAAQRLAGTLTLTVPRTGRASAKYRALGEAKAISLACRNWSACDETTGALSAVLTGRGAAGDYALDLTAAADGVVTVALTDPARPDGVTCLPLQNVWSKANPATDFAGRYTVDLEPTNATGNAFATGAGYLALTMNTTAATRLGKFTFAGRLPSGVSVSGSVRLTPQDWTTGDGFDAFWARGLLPVVQVGSGDSLAALLQIRPGAADPSAADMDTDGKRATGRCYHKLIRSVVGAVDGCAPFWRHVGKTDATSYEIDFAAYGAYYDATENLASVCASTLQSTSLTFFLQEGLNALDGDVLDALTVGDAVSEADWQPTAAAAGLKISYNTKTKANALALANAKTAKLASCSFSAASGIVSGTLTLGGKTLTFAGVAKPGWGYADCSECGTGGDEAQERPFIAGAAWFNDTFHYEDAKGRDRTETVRRSCAFSIGVKDGQ